MMKPAVWLSLLCAASGAQAQATRMLMPEGTYDLVLGVGLGITQKSEHDGGTRGVVVPALSVQWSNGVFADVGTRGANVGVNLSDDPGLSYGVMASVSGRDQRTDTPGERGGLALQAGGFVSWNPTFNTSLNAELQAGGGFDRGGVAGHVYGQYSQRIKAHNSVVAELGAFIADHSWMQGYFGVTPAQAASGGNPAYRAGAGLVSVYGDLGWNWQVSNKYWLNTGVRLSRLAGPAAASPLVGNASRLSARVSLTYHF